MGSKKWEDQPPFVWMKALPASFANATAMATGEIHYSIAPNKGRNASGTGHVSVRSFLCYRYDLGI